MPDRVPEREQEKLGPIRKSWELSADREPLVPPLVEVGTDRSQPPTLLITQGGVQALRVNADAGVIAPPRNRRGRLVMRFARLLRVVKPAPEWQGEEVLSDGS